MDFFRYSWWDILTKKLEDKQLFLLFIIRDEWRGPVEDVHEDVEINVLLYDVFIEQWWFFVKYRLKLLKLFEFYYVMRVILLSFDHVLMLLMNYLHDLNQFCLVWNFLFFFLHFVEFIFFTLIYYINSHHDI